MAADYADWGGLPALQQFIASLNLASQTLQATAAQIAAEIAIEGAPLLSGFTSLGGGLVALPAGGSNTVTMNTKFPAYQMFLNQTYHAAAGSSPFLSVHMNWRDPVTGQTLGFGKWGLAVPVAGAPFDTLGRGPSQGPQLQVTFTNLDSAQPVDVNYQFSGMTQYAQRDDWRSDGPNGVPGFTAFPSQMFGLVQGMTDPTITAGGSQTYLLPLYTGQVQLQVFTSASVSFSVTAALATPFDGLPAAQFYSQSFTAPPPGGIILNLPRYQCQFTVQNNGAVPAVFFLAMLPIEFAS